MAIFTKDLPSRSVSASTASSDRSKADTTWIISSSTPLSQRFRRAIKQNDLYNAKRIADKAFQLQHQSLRSLNDDHQSSGDHSHHGVQAGDATPKAARRAALAQRPSSSHPFDVRNVLHPNSREKKAKHHSVHHSGKKAKEMIPTKDEDEDEDEPSLVIAIKHGADLELCQWLIEMGHEQRGASMDGAGNTVLHLCCLYERPDILYFYSTTSTAYVSVPAASLVDHKNLHDQRTPLHISCLKGNEDLTRQLMTMGADLDEVDCDGNTPLHYASSWGHLILVQVLIERGCTFAKKNNQGFTAADFSFTHSVKAALEAFGRAQFEGRKQSRRKNGVSGSSVGDADGSVRRKESRKQSFSREVALSLAQSSQGTALPQLSTPLSSASDSGFGARILPSSAFAKGLESEVWEDDDDDDEFEDDGLPERKSSSRIGRISDDASGYWDPESSFASPSHGGFRTPHASPPQPRVTSPIQLPAGSKGGTSIASIRSKAKDYQAAFALSHARSDSQNPPAKLPTPPLPHFHSIPLPESTPSSAAVSSVDEERRLGTTPPLTSNPSTVSGWVTSRTASPRYLEGRSSLSDLRDGAHVFNRAGFLPTGFSKSKESHRMAADKASGPGRASLNHPRESDKFGTAGGMTFSTSGPSLSSNCGFSQRSEQGQGQQRDKEREGLGLGFTSVADKVRMRDAAAMNLFRTGSGSNGGTLSVKASMNNNGSGGGGGTNTTANNNRSKSPELTSDHTSSSYMIQRSASQGQFPPQSNPQGAVQQVEGLRGEAEVDQGDALTPTAPKKKLSLPLSTSPTAEAAPNQLNPANPVASWVGNGGLPNSISSSTVNPSALATPSSRPQPQFERSQPSLPSSSSLSSSSSSATSSILSSSPGLINAWANTNRNRTGGIHLRLMSEGDGQISRNLGGGSGASQDGVARSNSTERRPNLMMAHGGLGPDQQPQQRLANSYSSLLSSLPSTSPNLSPSSSNLALSSSSSTAATLTSPLAQSHHHRHGPFQPEQAGKVSLEEQMRVLPVWPSSSSSSSTSSLSVSPSFG